MARPVTYAQPRIDTKVRIRQDHADRIKDEVDSHRWGSRNALLEAALDQFFGMSKKAPRMPKADPAAKILPGRRPTGGAGKTPRLPKIGEAHAEASAAAQPAAPQVVSNLKTKHQPRRMPR